MGTSRLRWLAGTNPSVERFSSRLRLGLAVSWAAGTFAGGAALPAAAADRPLEPLAIRIATDADPAASARWIHRELNRLMRGAKEALSEASTVREKRDRFDRFFFTEAGFKPDGDRSSSDGLLLHQVLRRRQGTCVGLAQVYLILAERLRLPVATAATPTHLIARWMDGDSSINTELLEAGAEHSDSEYRNQHHIREPDPLHPVFLRNLTDHEVAARIYNNLGVIRSRAGQLQAGADYYARAIELDARFAAPYYNRGLDHLSDGRPAEALADFDAALSIYPADAWALNNRALARLRLGKKAEAMEDLRAALALDPDFPAAKRNLQLLSVETGTAATGPTPALAPQSGLISGEATGQRP